MKLEEEVRFWVDLFPFLSNWEIVVDEESSKKACCTCDAFSKKAVIYGWEGDGERPEMYAFHEVLHVICKCIKMEGASEVIEHRSEHARKTLEELSIDGDSCEEIAIQSLCNIVKWYIRPPIPSCNLVDD